ncbi:MAG TPA: hypothetical protein PL182_12920 [Pseudobdellovibrionaceae bacterium]|nr:hypothetical protein [Pseudobdellovibrionaceae bacterium]
MKFSSLIFVGVSLILSAQAQAAERALISSCKTQVGFDGSEMDIQIQIFRNADGGLIGESRTNGSGILTQKATVETHQVRAGLSAEDIETSESLNRGEALVVHAMALESMPEIGASAGMDLKEIRQVKTYIVGLEEQGDNPIGMTAIVEAQDGRGKAMGSYLGGFLIGKCQ